MRVSFGQTLDGGWSTTPIGQISAAGRWRGSDGFIMEIEREAALDALKREAAEYGADGIVGVRFEADEVKNCEIDGLALRRVTATGVAVRIARAA
ncbi:MAG TPA: heavy metal-binding domain-containing protein [Roseiarcus sp.]|nr:heavy metal-binding domain-containing protein [Roseiarcus sp.]